MSCRKILDQKIGMGMIGQNMGQFMQYQTAQAIPKLAEGVGQGGGSGVAGDAMGLGAGLAMGQVLAQQLQGGHGRCSGCRGCFNYQRSAGGASPARTTACCP